VDFGWRREKFLKKSKAAKSPRMAQITVGARPAKEDNEQRGCYLQMTLGLMIKGIYENVRRYLGREVTQGQFLMKFASKMTKLLLRQLDSKKFSPPAGPSGRKVAAQK
jgi:hypothetical protein